MSESTLPLVGLRVVDLTESLGESCGRILADLGGDVVKVEPPGGSAARATEPVHERISIPFALRNANKRSMMLDPDRPADANRFDEYIRRFNAADDTRDNGCV